MTEPSGPPRWPELPSRSKHRIASDVNTEIEGWLVDRAAELRAQGHTADDAMARARREFGDVDQTRDYCVAQDRAAERKVTRLRVFSEAWDDVRIAARSMARSPALALVLLVTMALGIGATTSIYSVVHALLLRPLPWADAERVVQLHSTEGTERQTMGQLSARAFLTLRENTKSFAGLAAVGPSSGALTGDGIPENVPGLRMSANTLELLGVRPRLGTGFAPGADSAGAEPVVILADGLWRRRFGSDPAIVGRTIDISGVSRRVLGVMSPEFIAPLFPQAELLVPLDISPVLAHPERKDKFRYLQVIGRVRPGEEGAARADADRIMARLAADRPEAYLGIGVVLVPVREEMTGSIRPALLALGAAAALLLLIACANIASVLLARLVSRQQELGVRVALG
ncbi:MAG: ABC transporter permease, partial [Cytophagaceae bacterium]|nr:ABC transporter permease [Gemmatimonadaceae bacterium]